MDRREILTGVAAVAATGLVGTSTASAAQKILDRGCSCPISFVEDGNRKIFCIDIGDLDPKQVKELIAATMDKWRNIHATAERVSKGIQNEQT